MSIDELRVATFEFFASPPAPPVTAKEALEIAPPEPFSQFDLRQMGRVAVSMREFRNIRRRAGDDETGLAGVLDRARELATDENPDLVKWALRLFITHDPVGQRLPIPGLEAVAPQMLLPSQRRVPEVSELEGAGVGDPAAALDWYREDPWANQHHEHWHTVYPWNDASKDRDGELFITCTSRCLPATTRSERRWDSGRSHPCPTTGSRSRAATIPGRCSGTRTTCGTAPVPREHSSARSRALRPAGPGSGSSVSRSLKDHRFHLPDMGSRLAVPKYGPGESAAPRRSLRIPS